MDEITPIDGLAPFAAKARPPKDKLKLDPIQRLTRDVREAAAVLGDDEARFLVDAYYIQQDDRKRSYAQGRSLREGSEPNSVIQWLAEQSSGLEKEIQKALDYYTRAHPMGAWMRAVYGVGPVISAGLLAHIYMGYWCAVCHGHNAKECLIFQQDKKRKLPPHDYQEVISCPTVGHIWQFAGIAGSGQKPWQKGTKRPFNAKFKTLCWKLGQSFMKFSNDDNCFYGKLYRQQKAVYIAKNEAGGFAETAAQRVATVGKSTEAFKHYAAGKLPPAHVDAMARRWAVKMFLAHLHDAWYRQHFGSPPPAPYPMAILGHAHEIVSQ